MDEKAVVFGRKIVSQQMYWAIGLHALLLFTLAYNYTLLCKGKMTKQNI